jgi:hypothetical protein
MQNILDATRGPIMSYLDDALACRGLLNPVAVVTQSEGRLQRLQLEARAAFALLCAQRLMDAHLRRPPSEQRPFTVSWAPVLQQIWTGFEETNNSSVKATVQGHLNAYYAGPFNHHPGEDGPDDADDDTAACSIYAAQAFCHGDAKSARWAAGRLVDSTYKHVQAARIGLPQSTLEEFAHPMTQLEARWLLLILDMLESQPWTPAMIPKLRAAFDQANL